jgi:hypothetical protein
VPGMPSELSRIANVMGTNDYTEYANHSA